MDNNSVDGSQQMVVAEFPHVKLIANDRNLGFAKANNMAICESRTKYVLFLNSDIVVVSDVLKKMLDYLEANHHVGIVGCRLLKPDLSVQPMTNVSFSIWIEVLRFSQIKRLAPSLRVRRFVARHFSDIIGKSFRSYLSAYLDEDRILEVDYVSGACLMARRDVFEGVGLFDEKFFLYYEDADFCLRTKQEGWQIHLLPYRGVIHHVGQSMNDEFLKVSDALNVSMYYYHSKHHSKGGVLFLKVIAILSLAARNGWLLLKRIFSVRDKRESIDNELRRNSAFIRRSISPVITPNSDSKHR